MKASVIICSYGRPASLTKCLASVDAEFSLYKNSEIILVYTNTDTGTGEMMQEFARTAKATVKIVCAEKRGLSVARNVGISNATGDLLIFTDDDCYMQPGYLGSVLAEMEIHPEYGYGGGGVHDALHNAPGTSHINQKSTVTPRTIIGAGVFSGCNMFFRREIFQKLGGFREDMGASSGTSFVGPEDLEMTTRANFSGYTGVLLPGPVIIHDHGRKPGTKEMADLYYAYDVSRGSFYAYMLAHGVKDIWNFWGQSFGPNQNGKMSKDMIRQLQLEFYGASEYLKYCLENDIDTHLMD